MNRKERRSKVWEARHPEPKRRGGPCGVRRYSRRKTTPNAAINVDLSAMWSDAVAFVLVHVDKRRVGVDRVDGTMQVEARSRS